jgi:hypothetical protein
LNTDLDWHGVTESAGLAFIDVVLRGAEGITNEPEFGRFAEVGDWKDFLENGLETFIFTFFWRDISLKGGSRHGWRFRIRSSSAPL